MEKENFKKLKPLFGLETADQPICEIGGECHVPAEKEEDNKEKKDSSSN